MFEKIKKKFKEVLLLSDSPRKIALAFAIGVFIAFSPILGFHTIMVLLVAWLFRLNPVALFAGAFVNNPWTFTPLYGFCLWFGIYLYGGTAAFPHISWEHLSLLTFLGNLKPFIAPFLLGTTIVGVVFSFLSYLFSYFLICRFKESRAKQEN